MCPVSSSPAPPAASVPYSSASSVVPAPSAAAIVSDVEARTSRLRNVNAPILPGIK